MRRRKLHQEDLWRLIRAKVALPTGKRGGLYNIGTNQPEGFRLAETIAYGGFTHRRGHRCHAWVPEALTDAQLIYIANLIATVPLVSP